MILAQVEDHGAFLVMISGYPWATYPKVSFQATFSPPAHTQAVDPTSARIFKSDVLIVCQC